VRSVLSEAGLEAEGVCNQLESATVKEELRRRTDEALRLGIFGAPSFVVNGSELFWGQDRLLFVEQALRS
jgi:2-hydroxychromene-2-carboxylate isomerase